MLRARYLIDASALYPIIVRLKERLIDNIDMFAILDLTLYEVGNVVWKEYRKGKISDLDKVLSLFREIFSLVGSYQL